MRSKTTARPQKARPAKQTPRAARPIHTAPRAKQTQPAAGGEVAIHRKSAQARLAEKIHSARQNSYGELHEASEGGFTWKGREFTEADFRHSWEVEFAAGEAAPFRALRPIDATRCQTAQIRMTHAGEFFLAWAENHPTRGRFLDYEGPAAAPWGGRFTMRNEEQLAVWRQLCRNFPDSHWFAPLTREEAFTIIAWFWMPAEFHKELALEGV